VARTTNTRRPQRPKADKFGLVFDSNVGKQYRKIKRDDNNSARPQRSPHYMEYFVLRGRRIRDDAATWGCHELLDEVESCSVQPSTLRVPRRYSTKTPAKVVNAPVPLNRSFELPVKTRFSELRRSRLSDAELAKLLPSHIRVRPQPARVTLELPKHLRCPEDEEQRSPCA